MEEPGLIVFECDSAMDSGVHLVVTPTVTSVGDPVTCFAIKVDGSVLAAYVGPKDVESLIAFLQRNRR